MGSRAIKKVRDRVLREYAKSVMEFEVAMAQRRAGMKDNVSDKKMLDWCISSNNRFNFSRVASLASLQKKPMRKSEISKMIGCSFQNVSQIIAEAVALGYAIENREGKFQASEVMIEGCLEYVQERHRLISTSLIKNAQIWENFNEIYQLS